MAREKKRAFSFTCTAAPQLKRPPHGWLFVYMIYLAHGHVAANHGSYSLDSCVLVFHSSPKWVPRFCIYHHDRHRFDCAHPSSRNNQTIHYWISHCITINKFKNKKRIISFDGLWLFRITANQYLGLIELVALFVPVILHHICVVVSHVFFSKAAFSLWKDIYWNLVSCLF